jgi:MFS family permease
MEKSATKWWVLSAVACGTFMATLDASIVNIALPTMTKSLATNLLGVNWVIATYFLVITCLLLPFGRLSDLYGRKRVFLLGYMIFTLGSIFCGVSVDLAFLIISRAIQALGAAMLMANGPAIITAAFPSNERGKALGTLAMVVSAGLISGPSVGGILISFFGWRSIFLLNIPVGILGGYLVVRFIAKDKLQSNHPPFDWVGAVLQFLILLLLIVVFDPPYIPILGDSPLLATRLGALLFALSLIVIFLRNEMKVLAPLFDLSLIRDRTFFSANLSGFLTFVSYSSVTVLMPFFLEEKLSLTTDQAGRQFNLVPVKSSGVYANNTFQFSGASITIAKDQNVILYTDNI